MSDAVSRPAWSVLPEEWKPLLTARGLRAFRAEQILHSLYRDWIMDWDAATTLPKDFRETLKTEFPLRVSEVLAQTAPRMVPLSCCWDSPTATRWRPW